MGYCVWTVETKFNIKNENFDNAYRAVCELNKHDELKRGGGGKRTFKPENSKSLSNNPNKWFSWMTWNYDETCHNLVEVIEELNFDVDVDDDGICGLHYDCKTGSEDVFFEALAPYVEDGSYIIWKGEVEGDAYKWVFENGKMEVIKLREIYVPVK